MKPLKIKVSVTLDHDIVEKLKGLAEKDDRSFSQLSILCLECIWKTTKVLPKIFFENATLKIKAGHRLYCSPVYGFFNVFRFLIIFYKFRFLFLIQKFYGKVEEINRL